MTNDVRYAKRNGCGKKMRAVDAMTRGLHLVGVSFARYWPKSRDGIVTIAISRHDSFAIYRWWPSDITSRTPTSADSA
ncbi:MAG: hypothetical protein Q7S95_01440 [bacterium]|nr:hypothetical protein [bacterium]